MTERWDTLLLGGSLATMDPDRPGPWGEVLDGAVGIRGSEIAFVGSSSNLPEPAAELAGRVIDARGCWITPALIDCHTHLVYGGDRADEFEQRLEGASYADIARAGGGILSTVRATRAASDQDLLRQAETRLRDLLSEGVATIEIKSGYGLDLATERKMLRVARRLGERANVEVQTTFLGAHALPPEAADADRYIEGVCAMIPELAQEGLIDAVDGFCESIAFSPAQIERVFAAAVEAGLPVKLHAEQLSNLGGAALAARFGALSADHLEYLDRAGVEAMAAAGTVAVLLPGAFYYLRETQAPPIDALREHGVPIALATDCNPGSSPVTSLLATLNQGCVLFRLTPAEAFAGVTREAARALGLTDRGSLGIGLRADLAIWDAPPRSLAYALGPRPLRERWVGGARVDP